MADSRHVERESRPSGRGSRSRVLRVEALVVGLALVAAAPALAAVVSGTTYSFAPDATSGWKNSDQVLTFEVTPTAGTTATLHYSTDGGGTWSSITADATGTASFEVSITAEGSHAFQYYASDDSSTPEATKTPGFVNIDKTAPETTGTAGGRPLAASPTSDWWTTSQWISLTASDTLSGPVVGGTTYRVRSGNLSIYESPFEIDRMGSTEITFRSIDRAGNVEATRTAYVNIDGIAPTVSATPTPRRASGWYNTNVTVSVTASDTLSGVATLQYRESTGATWADVEGGQFTLTTAGNLGRHSYEYRAVDRAGNAASGTITVNIDTVGPTTFAKNATTRVGTPVKLWYRATDGLSPKVKQVFLKIRRANGSVVQNVMIPGEKKVGTWFSVNWTPRARGSFTYGVYAKDLAGNVQSTRGSGAVTVR